MQIEDIDLVDPDNFVSGRHHEMFKLLRAEDPVHWTEPEGEVPFWSITKLRDLQTVNRDTETFSSETGGTQRIDIASIDPTFDTRGLMLIDTDPPKHTRYRRIVNKGFTPRMIGLLETHLLYRAELIVDEVIGAGECDFVNDLAAELPLQAIVEMMGVPQKDRHLIFEWTNTMIGMTDPEYVAEEGDEDAGRNAAMQLYMYSNALAAERRDDPRDDIVTKLLNADVDGEALTEEEFDMFMLLLSVAGSETTRTATSHGMQALFDHPDQMRLMLDNLDDDDFIATAIEEIVRWATPVHHFRRTAAVDTELRGKKIKAGDKVVAGVSRPTGRGDLRPSRSASTSSAPQRALRVRWWWSPLLPWAPTSPRCGSSAWDPPAHARRRCAGHPELLRSFINGSSTCRYFTPASANAPGDRWPDSADAPGISATMVMFTACWSGLRSPCCSRSPCSQRRAAMETPIRRRARPRIRPATGPRPSYPATIWL